MNVCLLPMWAVGIAMEPAADEAGVRILGPGSQMDVSGWMSLLTWTTFIIAFVILYKLAWKPILNVLDRREKEIAKALEDAAKAREATEKAVAEQKRILSEAAEEARRIHDEARQAALALASSVEARARDQSRAMIEDASREIEFQRAQASASLRIETAELAAQLAEKVLTGHTCDPERADFTRRMVSELQQHESR